ncbi:MAG: PH domain-containing protein [Bacteroidota bacterium]|jgi:hypothetical protein|uniref:PH domain-containing protein n=1 Tax=Parabacteroides sp. FAFU027 TaxID=2922715 RepID=UPI001FAFCF32|nr:PH domain-containing protein [Parabacteroides sp. FAFU027]MDP4270393.1 PH domain-containing protein [Bacteroidota bacterium]
MRFRCLWSKTVRVITVIALLIIGFGLYQSAVDGHTIIFFIILLATLYCLAYSPICIDINEDDLIVRRMFSSVIIHRKDIIAISAYKSGYAIRKFGSGGLFGYLGWFYNSEIGSYFSYATDERNMILIITKNRKYVISCEKPNELLSRFI